MGIFSLIKNALKEEKEGTPVDPKSSYKEEVFCVVGVIYHLPNVNKLACANSDWRKNGKTLLANGLCGKKIFRYSYINKPVKLIPEPKNPHDKYAVMVQIAGEKVGYISQEDNRHVLEILNKRQVKFISSFISGGPYKVVSENGDAVKLEKDISIRIKIGYRE